MNRSTAVSERRLGNYLQHLRTWKRGRPHARREAFRAELLTWWDALEEGVEAGSLGIPSAWRGHLESVVEGNRTLLREESARISAQHIFDALPEPVVAFTERGTAWNSAFAAVMGEEGSQPSQCASHRGIALLRLLHELIQNRHTYLRNGALFYPSGDQLFSVTIRIYPERRLHIVYFTKLSCPAPRLPHAARLVITLRASGLSLKQIALLLGASESSVTYLSRQHKKPLQALRKQLIESASVR